MSESRIDELTNDMRADFERIINRFEDDWNSLAPPLIDRYLSDCPGQRNSLLVELVLIDLEFRLKAGEAARVERYFERYPQLRKTSTIAVDLLTREFNLRCRLQGSLDPGEYQQRFPQFAAQFSAALERQATLDRASRPDLLTTEPVSVQNGKTELPAMLGRYRIVEELGSGSFGVVYRGYDDELRREVAIKVPHRQRVESPQDIETYLAEARALASLNHPGIVPVYDVGRTDDGRCYLVSQFIESSDLASRISQGRMPTTEAVEIVASVAEALHHAHQRGLYHRDVKPANILLNRHGQPVVADFGLALREEDFGKGTAFAGTPSYMSPEQARGEGHRVDARTDVYSLGVVLYELLTGCRPFQGATVGDILEQIKNREPRPPRQLDDRIPRELDRIALRALSKRASERYSTAIDLAEDLRHWQKDKHPEPEAPAREKPALASATASDSSTLACASGSTPSSGIRNLPSAIKVVPKGLRSFDATDADFFLELLPGPRNRDGLPESMRFWLAAIQETDPDKSFSVGLLYGPSGCGKSSLVKAGLLPRLGEEIVSIYLEATPDETERRLLKHLHKRCPDLSPQLGLVDSITALRRGGKNASRKKVLIVLDQFEQWLHAQSDDKQSELVEALRQCDGQRVQCLLLVRDDFWMAATRFMRELEVRLIEGQNSAAADLFDLRHARKILAAFGRAFGSLPEASAKPQAEEVLSAEQNRFLDHATEGLAQDGKIIPVRLALFSEMVKGRPWTSATLREVGGMQGIGITFLDEKFSSPTAPPEHRLHQKAARAVLKALSPAQGTDIKGHRRSHQELLAVSGYARHPQEFAALMRILDTELRLVTPTESEMLDSEPEAQARDNQNLARASGSGISGRYYQLTHDYLVPALRQWLTRKQRETPRGRAELLLADRAAAWNARPEWRQLPTVGEGLRILLFTRWRDWSNAERKMLSLTNWLRIMRPLISAGLLTILVVLAFWGLIEWAIKFQVQMRVQGLANEDLGAVPGVVRELRPFRRTSLPLLQRMAGEAPPDSRQQVNASLALLLLADQSQLDFIYERMLTATPDELPLLCHALKPHHDKLLDRLWTETESGKDGRRLRAACALAMYDPKHERWPKVRAAVVEELLTQKPLLVGKWCELLKPAREALTPALRDVAEDTTRPEGQRSLAKNILEEYEAKRLGE